ncbi:MAG: PD-(D/E)XK nuclease family protein, partial [Muribaculaceae bacterium]|nr:PD-(D/E)XK nuclease family protein [Muribaculaceae bacterium]
MTNGYHTGPACRHSLPEPFLKSIARVYADTPQEQLLDFCFVFPNKRSATFFSHYIAGFQRKKSPTSIQPETTTISDFVDNLTPGIPAERLEQILLLYRAYRRVLERRSESVPGAAAEIAAEIDINKFVYWADVLLSDFSDVDMYLADPKEIFRNVELLREISSNYLQPEDWKAAERFLNLDKSSQRHVAEFWNHIMHNGADGERSKAVSGFVRIWQVMDDVYREFHGELRDRGLRTSAMAYIEAMKFLETADRTALPFKRYIFVGFTMLSKAEERIFALLRDMPGHDGEPMADFYWDVASPVFRDKDNSAAGFMGRYVREFPSLYDCVEPLDSFPEIHIIGVPSRAAQSQIACNLESPEPPFDIEADSPHAAEALRHTAVILPDETMVFPVVSAIPGQIKPLNITMGYRLRNSPIWGLTRSVVSLQLRGRKEGDGYAFFNEDVRRILSHPVLRDSMGDTCSLAMRYINESHLIMIRASLFANPEFSELRPVFTPVPPAAPAESVFAYLRELLSWLDSLIAGKVDETEPTEEEAALPEFDEDGEPIGTGAKGSVARLVDRVLLRRYAAAADHLEELTGRYLDPARQQLVPSTVCSMVERLISGETVNFEGRPLRGLQIMGVLEARSLDFHTVILPSMNEKIFPRTRFQPSFIPEQLRRAYGLSTIEHQEGIFAYYFYRMISRAGKVFLLYDTRPGSRGGGQMSRYLHQLQRVYHPAGLTRELIPFNIPSPDEALLSQRKTPAILEKLERFRSRENPLYLSPSSVNTYIDCPMKFYLAYIADYKEERDILDWLDEGTYGTIVHEAIQKMYDSRLAHPGGARVDDAALAAMSDDTAAIGREVTRAINRYYLLLGENNDTPLPPSSAIMGRMITRQIADLFRLEKGFGPFTYLGGEIPYENHLMFTGSFESDEPGAARRGFAVNMKCKIDRVDRLDEGGLLRIVDYKTGGD